MCSSRAGWEDAILGLVSVVARIAADDTCRSVVADEGAAVAAQTALVLASSTMPEEMVGDHTYKHTKSLLLSMN